LQAWRGELWEKGTEEAFPHMGKGCACGASGLFLPLLLFATQIRSLSSRLSFSPEVGKYVVNATSSEMGPQSLDLSQD